MKGLAVAVALGVLGAGLAFVLDTQLPDRTPEQPYLAPFTHGNGTSTFLVLLKDRADWTPLDTCHGAITPHGQQASWIRVRPGCDVRYGDLNLTTDVGLEPVGNATRIWATWYIFDDLARLIATNADDAPRFKDHPDQQHLDIDGIYLGDGATPTGFADLPIPAPELEQALAEAWVGGIVGVYVDDHPYVGYLGPVYVSLRVDGVAP